MFRNLSHVCSRATHVGVKNASGEEDAHTGIPYSVRMSEERVKTAILGVGRWGKNVARELAAQSELVAYAQRGEADNGVTEIEGVEKMSTAQICDRTDIQAVWIATPIDTHADIARVMLESGKHVMCEKPLALEAAGAEALASLADEKGLTLATGYVFLYHPVYQEMRRLLASDTIASVECEWNKYGTFAESIEMNLLTHHLSLSYHLLGMPQSGTYVSREAGETPCDKLITELVYDNASFMSRINRLSQTNEHRIEVRTHSGITYEWIGQTLKKDGAVIFESADQPLTREVAAFLASISGGSTVITAGRFGADVLRIHELL